MLKETCWEPDGGKLQVRFCEGGDVKAAPLLTNYFFGLTLMTKGKYILTFRTQSRKNWVALRNGARVLNTGNSSGKSSLAIYGTWVNCQLDSFPIMNWL